jgi:hypothetical protein
MMICILYIIKKVKKSYLKNYYYTDYVKMKHFWYLCNNDIKFNLQLNKLLYNLV